VDNNGYSVINLANDGTIRILGFRNQMSYHWSVGDSTQGMVCPEGG
jgi:hypothetical protein